MNGPSLGFLNLLNAGLTEDPFTTESGAMAPPTAESARQFLAPPTAAPPVPAAAAPVAGPVATPWNVPSGNAHTAPPHDGVPSRGYLDGLGAALQPITPDAAKQFLAPAPPPSAAAVPIAAPMTAPAQPAGSAPSGPSSAPMPDDVQYRQVGGGQSIPAHEAYGRGPEQDAYLRASFEAEPEAATRGDFRNQIQADREQAFYEEQAAQAQKQQEAAQAVAAKRAFQLEQLQLDYADQVQKLGQMKFDGNRWWSKKSTPDKIASMLLVALGGVSALGNGGHNLAYDGVMKEIDDDAASQRFDWDAGLAQTQGAQNAFKMMMDRYNNEDAAEAAIRAAGLHAAEAKLGSLHAQYGGIESANAADMLRARFADTRDKTISDGFKLIPAQHAGSRYEVTVRGHKLPGTFDEKSAQGIGLEHNVKPAEQLDQELTKGGIQSTLQAQNNAATTAREVAKEQNKDTGDRSVVLDGKNALALSKTAAEKWNEYNHGRAVFSLALEALKKARTDGSPAAYNAARAELIEEYPKLLGYTRAPTQGQISSTVGPEAIPEYNHWFDHAKYGPAAAATYPVMQGRAQEKIDLLDKTLATSDKAMRENTFGAAAGKIDGPVKASELKGINFKDHSK